MPSKQTSPAVLLGLSLLAASAAAHPLGNFTVNHFSKLEVSQTAVALDYVIDIAEIPAFGELRAADLNKDGSTSQAELDGYATRVAGSYIAGVRLLVDGQRADLTVRSERISKLPGAGGLFTLRLEYSLQAPISLSDSATHQLQFEDNNHPDRIGWREIVVRPGSGIQIFDSSAFGNSISDELRRYPPDLLAAPLAERRAALRFTTGLVPANARLLRTRDGQQVTVSRDRFAELINVAHVTPGIAFLAIFIAAFFGAAHALSPGHGKTIVGAYLVGSRGTPKHALFLGLTVTITHTAGVFALGLVTLFASRYVLPERLFPILSLLSGALVVTIGLSLFARRLANAVGGVAEHSHELEIAGEAHVHSHGGRAHSHLPPGTQGETLTWRSLLALGISGGLLPCPSALVVLLSAIALHRVGYGLILVLAFSVGLAGTLTGVGLAFVYAGRWLSRFGSLPKMDALRRFVPVLSSLAVSCLGAAICYGAIREMGIHPLEAFGTALVNARIAVTSGRPLASLSGFAVLTYGLILGIKHATEADHVIAVSNIVSEHRRLTKIALVGGLWGVGHTVTLVVVGFFVLILGLTIPEHVSQYFEFGIGLMIIALSSLALSRALSGRTGLHVHAHSHGPVSHSHMHFHDSEQSDAPGSHSHSFSRIGLRPLLVGAMHGLAGSAALTLLVLTQVHTVWLGVSYLLLFGIGSIFGMMGVSTLIGLPFAMGAARLSKMTVGLQVATGLVGICFGLWYAYSTGMAALHS